MSWDRTEYELTCEDCGQKGAIIVETNDWMQTRTSFVGFTVKERRTKKGSSYSGSCVECGGAGKCEHEGFLL